MHNSFFTAIHVLFAANISKGGMMETRHGLIRSLYNYIEFLMVPLWGQKKDWVSHFENSGLQWNSSKPDTVGTEKVSCLWRCPHFRGLVCIGNLWDMCLNSKEGRVKIWRSSLTVYLVGYQYAGDVRSVLPHLRVPVL